MPWEVELAPARQTCPAAEITPPGKVAPARPRARSCPGRASLRHARLRLPLPFVRRARVVDLAGPAARCRRATGPSGRSERVEDQALVAPWPAASPPRRPCSPPIRKHPDSSSRTGCRRRRCRRCPASRFTSTLPVSSKPADLRERRRHAREAAESGSAARPRRRVEREAAWASASCMLTEEDLRVRARDRVGLRSDDDRGARGGPDVHAVHRARSRHIQTRTCRDEPQRLEVDRSPRSDELFGLMSTGTGTRGSHAVAIPRSPRGTSLSSSPDRGSPAPGGRRPSPPAPLLEHVLDALGGVSSGPPNVASSPTASARGPDRSSAAPPLDRCFGCGDWPRISATTYRCCRRRRPLHADRLLTLVGRKRTLSGGRAPACPSPAMTRPSLATMSGCGSASTFHSSR